VEANRRASLHHLKCFVVGHRQRHVEFTGQQQVRNAANAFFAKLRLQIVEEPRQDFIFHTLRAIVLVRPKVDRPKLRAVGGPDTSVCQGCSGRHQFVPGGRKLICRNRVGVVAQAPGGVLQARIATSGIFAIIRNARKRGKIINFFKRIFT